jgi:competence protein ComEC
VLKVAHHGSKTSSTAAFLDLAQPTFAVISAGFENSYGHPHAEVVERFEERRTGLLRTDLDGLVTVRSDGRVLEMDMARWSGALGSAAGEGLPREF